MASRKQAPIEVTRKGKLYIRLDLRKRNRRLSIYSIRNTTLNELAEPNEVEFYIDWRLLKAYEIGRRLKLGFLGWRCAGPNWCCHGLSAAGFKTKQVHMTLCINFKLSIYRCVTVDTSTNLKEHCKSNFTSNRRTSKCCAYRSQGFKIGALSKLMITPPNSCSRGLSTQYVKM